MARRKKTDGRKSLVFLESPSTTTLKQIPKEYINSQDMPCAEQESITPRRKSIWVSPQFRGIIECERKKTNTQETRSKAFMKSQIKKLLFVSEGEKIRNEASKNIQNKHQHQNLLESNIGDAPYMLKSYIEEISALKNDDISASSTHGCAGSLTVKANSDLLSLLKNCNVVIHKSKVLVPSTPLEKCGLSVKEKQLRRCLSIL